MHHTVATLRAWRAWRVGHPVWAALHTGAAVGAATALVCVRVGALVPLPSSFIPTQGTLDHAQRLLLAPRPGYGPFVSPLGAGFVLPGSNGGDYGVGSLEPLAGEVIATPSGYGVGVSQAVAPVGAVGGTQVSPGSETSGANVPEPASASLLGLTLGVAIYFRVRR